MQSAVESERERVRGRERLGQALNIINEFLMSRPLAMRWSFDILLIVPRAHAAALFFFFLLRFFLSLFYSSLIEGLCSAFGPLGV
jgi:hypothetical protein